MDVTLFKWHQSANLEVGSKKEKTVHKIIQLKLIDFYWSSLFDRKSENKSVSSFTIIPPPP